MDKAFRTHKRQLASHERPTNGPKRARSESSPEPEAKTEGPRRAKLSDRLQDERGNTAGQKPYSDTARGRASRKLSPSSKRHGTRRSPSTDDHGVEIPVIKYTPQSSTRSTRSMARRMPPTTIVWYVCLTITGWVLLTGTVTMATMITISRRSLM